MGLNLYLSEVVSEISEPMVGTLDGGAEVISGEDLIANMDILNEGIEGWHVGWTCEGVTEGNLVSCGTCNGSDDGDFDDQPEVCKCEGTSKDTCDNDMNIKGTMELETSMNMDRDLDTCEDGMLHSLNEGLKSTLKISSEEVQEDGMLRDLNDEYEESNKDTCGDVEVRGTIELETSTSMEQSMLDMCDRNPNEDSMLCVMNKDFKKTLKISSYEIKGALENKTTKPEVQD